MIDLCPRFLLRFFPMANRKYLCYVITAFGIAFAAAFTNLGIWQQSVPLLSGNSLIGRIRDFTHFGFRCPLCGGTRSFLSMFSGNILEALHYSIFGTFVFMAVYFILPFRLVIAFNLWNMKALRIEEFDLWFEKYLIHILCIAFVLQVALDYFGVFIWMG